ncbi:MULTISPECIES: hypothetical protein [Aneurinibacillus]|nr:MULTISPECIES: hypothetical protein [Aneurinibacillus]
MDASTKKTGVAGEEKGFRCMTSRYTPMRFEQDEYRLIIWL